jgi:hypothetical protein
MENIHIFLLILVLILLIIYFINKEEKFEINDSASEPIDNNIVDNIVDNIDDNIDDNFFDNNNDVIIDVPGKCGVCTPIKTDLISDPSKTYNVSCPQDCSNKQDCSAYINEYNSVLGSLCF